MSRFDKYRQAYRKIVFGYVIILALVMTVPSKQNEIITTAEAQPASVATRGYEGQFYYSLDLLRAVREQYGTGAVLVWTGDHLYNWAAKVGTKLLPLDLKRAVTRQYGRDWTLVATGVHRYDWAAVNFHNLKNVILPVMPVASDQFYNITGVRQGLSNYRSVLTCTQNWYGRRVGKTFRLLQPLIIPTNLTSAQWNRLSAISTQADHRYDLLNVTVQAYKQSLPSPSSNLPVALATYTGNSPDVWLGAADIGGFAFAPPRATSITCLPNGPLDLRGADATYAIGHELGHAFGLGHSCETYPNESACGNSIMQTGKPEGAILLPEEISALRSSPFFS